MNNALTIVVAVVVAVAAAVATSFLLASQRDNTPAFETETYLWKKGTPPVKMIHSDTGICYLTQVGGGFAGGGEKVRVYVDEEDGFWYLHGSSQQGGTHARATSVIFK